MDDKAFENKVNWDIDKAKEDVSTLREDAPAKVERQVGKSTAPLLFDSRIGERFDAVVTGASENRTWVRILKQPIECKLVQGIEGIDIGDQLQVQLIDTTIEQAYIDFKKIRERSLSSPIIFTSITSTKRKEFAHDYRTCH